MSTIFVEARWLKCNPILALSELLLSYRRNFWGNEFPILLLVLVVRNCTRYVHKINERKVYVPTLSSSDYEIRIKYKYDIVDTVPVP